MNRIEMRHAKKKQQNSAGRWNQTMTYTYTINNNNFPFSFSLSPFTLFPPPPPVSLELSSLSDRMWYCCASPSATQSLCAIARRCGFRRSAAFVPTRPSCSSDARTIFASCTATRPTCPTSRIETRLCGKTNDIKAAHPSYLPSILVLT